MTQSEDDLRLQSSYERLQRGAVTPNQLIGDATYLAPSVVDDVLASIPGFRYLKDDLNSVATFAIVHTCQDLSPGINNLAAYLTSAIDRAVKEAIAEEDDQGASPRHQRRDPERDKFRPESLGDTADQLAAKTDRSHELLEDIESGCCLDELDRKIVKLRREYRPDAEVAAILDVAESTVTKRRGAIYKRFLDRNQEYRLAT